jgi:tetratricopeptide (TPR) repeat protein
MLLAFSQDDFDTLMRRGFELHREQQYSRSIPLLERALAIRPGEYAVNLLLGIDLLRSGQPRKALVYFESARKIDAGQPEPLGYEADAYAACGEFDRTAGILRGMAERSGEAAFTLIQFYLRRFGELAEQLRSTTAGLAQAYRLEAFALHERRDPKEREVLLRAEALMPGASKIASALGQALLIQSRFEEASREFSRALAHDSGDLDAMVGNAVVAAHNGDLTQAKHLLTVVSQQSPHRLAVAYREWPRAVPLSPELVLKAADDGTRELLGMAPQNGTPTESFRFGVALAGLGRWEDAIVPLERAERDKGFRLDSAYWLSLCYSRGAEERTERLGSKPTNRQWIAAVRGEVLLRLVHDGPAAAAEFRMAAALAPADPALRTGLAESQLLAGDTAAARNSARKALDLDPLRGAAMRVIAEAAMQERDYSAAIPALERLLAIHENDIAAQVLLGTAYARTRSADRAAHYLQAALDQGYPDERGTVHYVLGTALRQLGRDEEATRLFQRAQALSDAFARSTKGISH